MAVALREQEVVMIQKTVDVIIGDIESPIPDLATLPILTGIVILS
jgi:hypothetical protein